MKRMQEEGRDNEESQSLMSDYFKCRKFWNQSSVTNDCYTNQGNEMDRIFSFANHSNSGFQGQESQFQNHFPGHSTQINYGMFAPGCPRFMSTGSSNILSDEMCRSTNFGVSPPEYPRFMSTSSSRSILSDEMCHNSVGSQLYQNGFSGYGSERMTDPLQTMGIKAENSFDTRFIPNSHFQMASPYQTVETKVEDGVDASFIPNSNIQVTSPFQTVGTKAEHYIDAGFIPNSYFQITSPHQAREIEAEDGVNSGFIPNSHFDSSVLGSYGFTSPEYSSSNTALIKPSQNERNTLSSSFNHRKATNYAKSPKVNKKKGESSVRVDKPVKLENTQRGIFQFEPDCEHVSIADRYLLIEKQQCMDLTCVAIPEKVAYVYNPLDYAFETHCNFIQRFCNSPKMILFLGMNPGPWGMSQNGVPFGENKMVKDWLCVKGNVRRPCPEHPKRPITGMNCTRSEVSGSRFWSLFQELCGNPETFFTNCFVYNLCPLAFMADSGKNVTVPQMDSATRQKINAICERSLLEVVDLLKISIIVGIGKFASDQARKILRSASIDTIRVESIMHPSPINPAANRGWSTIAQQQLQQSGLLSIISPRQ